MIRSCNIIDEKCSQCGGNICNSKLVGQKQIFQITHNKKVDVFPIDEWLQICRFLRFPVFFCYYAVAILSLVLVR